MSNTSTPVICFGEVLWDVYPQMKRLGGAPFNVAAHLTQLGQEVFMISRVGKDAMGDEIKTAIHEQNLPLSTIQEDEVYPTGTVDVLLEDEGKPTYQINSPVAWDFIQSSHSLVNLVTNCSAFVYGSLSCRNDVSRSTLFQLVGNAPKNICDLNIRQGFYNQSIIEQLLDSAHILKINDDEASLLQNLFGLNRNNLYKSLSERFDIDIVIQTLGEKGAELYVDGRIIQVPGISIEVKDTVGSGDAFLAGFIHFFMQELPLETALSHGCRLGAYVATQPGAIPKLDINLLKNN